MKKLYLFAALLAGLCFAGCAPVNDDVAIVPYPNGIEPGRGYYKLGPGAIACMAVAKNITPEIKLRAKINFIAGFRI